MVNSQNGWPASADRLSIGVIGFIEHGVNFPGGVKAGDVATVLGYVASQYHVRVEALVSGWCWGHNFRRVTGDSSSVSNHGSGTAIDINAPKHAYGKHGTFTGVQRAHLRAIMEEVGGVVRWGGDYAGTVDEMHFEIVGTAASVATVAARLRKQSQPEEANPVRNLILAKEKGTDRVWVGDGLTRRHVADQKELEGLQYWIGQMGGNATIRSPWDDLRVLGIDITAEESAAKHTFTDDTP